MNAVMETPQSKHTSLFYREGSSDKEYHVSLEPKGQGYVVNFAYGRRGSTLNTGIKTSQPVYYDAALMLFDKLVNEKKAKGYTEATHGKTYQHTDKADRVSGLLPQLLNPIDEEAVVKLISDPQWCLQEKLDGRRILLRKENGAIEGINRKGLIVGLPQSILTTAQELKGEFVMDGECMGDKLHVFDLLMIHNQDLRPQNYRDRLVELMNLMASGLPKHIRLVETAFEPMDKATSLRKLQQSKAEGIVLKHLDAPYVAGRPNSGGTQLKHKFYATLSAVVSKHNAQRSVQLSLLNQDGWNGVGNVTIPANHVIPVLGSVVEIRYLYAYPNGSLYQPVYLGLRRDVGQEECGMSQLKLKRENEDGEEE